MYINGIDKQIKKNDMMFKMDFTLEECLGKDVFIKIMVDEFDTDTEVWIINDLIDYEGLKKALIVYNEDGILDEYFIYKEKSQS